MAIDALHRLLPEFLTVSGLARSMSKTLPSRLLGHDGKKYPKTWYFCGLRSILWSSHC